MRGHILLCGLVAGCATSQAGKPLGSGDIAIALTRARGEASPAIAVTMRNRSQADLCIRAELLKNPYTYEMHFRLKDARGRAVKLKSSGYLNEPIVEPVRIAPGERVRAIYFLEHRFELPGDGKSLSQGMNARAVLHYDACDGSLSQQAASAWQRI